MRVAALIVGILAGLCAVMGILTFNLAVYGVGFLEDIPTSLAFYEFWFWVSALLFLATIVLAVVHREE